MIPQLQTCPNCGSEAKSRVVTWCDECSPMAPFKREFNSVKRAADATLGERKKMASKKCSCGNSNIMGECLSKPPCTAYRDPLAERFAGAAPRLRLLKFTAEWCAPCKAMKKARTLEKFKELHPTIEILEIDVDDGHEVQTPQGGKPSGADIADAYKVKSMPTLVIEAGPPFPAPSRRLARHLGGASLKDLEALLKKALKKLAEPEEG